jgi:hypothetical protein
LATESIDLNSTHCRLSGTSSGLVHVLSLKSDTTSHFALSASVLSLLELLRSSSNSNEIINKALKICRFNNEKLTWTILATHALAMGDLMTAEVALAALNLLDKVRLIQRISASENSPQSQLDSCLLLNKKEKAAQVLRNTSNPFFRVRHFTRAFNFSEAWSTAEEVCSQDSSLSWIRDFVLYKRKRFIDETCQGNEFDPFFKKLKPSETLESIKSKKKALLS